MSEYRMTVKGLEARVFLTPNPFNVHTHGVTYDENAIKVAERGSVTYQGYCDWEIVYDVAGDMLHSRRGIEYDDIAAAVDALGLVCECEED